MKDLNEVVSRKIDDLHNEIGDRHRKLEAQARMLVWMEREVEK